MKFPNYHLSFTLKPIDDFRDWNWNVSHHPSQSISRKQKQVTKSREHAIHTLMYFTTQKYVLKFEIWKFETMYCIILTKNHVLYSILCWNKYHTIILLIMPEANKKLKSTSDKKGLNKVQWDFEYWVRNITVVHRFEWLTTTKVSIALWCQISTYTRFYKSHWKFLISC